MISTTEKSHDLPGTTSLDSGDVDKMPAKTLGPDEDETQYPKGVALALIVLSLLFTMFLVALDRTILATAIPKITDEWHSLDDVGWYGSSYMLTNCSMQLLYGKIYKLYSTKWVFLTCILIFEVGSVVCASAPNSIAFIIGRAIAGLGSAGIASGGMMILFYSVPLHKRPIFQGMFGATFGIASVVGPLLGGIFTDKLTWRWCFWINMPIGGLAFLFVLVILKLPYQERPVLSFYQQLTQLDPLGTVLFLPSMVCLILALQWGGTTYSWNDGRIIALLIVFAILILAFISVQIWKGDEATVPPRIATQRSMASGALFTLCTAGSMMSFIYYLPIWFQSIKGVSPFQSGIDTLPLIISLVVASILSGIATTKMGYYVPAMIISSVLTSIGAGLITTFKPNTSHGEWIGLQVLFGFGLGLAMQVIMLAAQAVLPRADVSTGTAMVFFYQQLGGAIFISVAENLFEKSLISGVSNIPGLDPETIINIGATDLQSSVDPKYLDTVRAAYNQAVTRPFLVGTILVCISIIGSLGMEWKSVKKGQQEKTGELEEMGETGKTGEVPVEK